MNKICVLGSINMDSSIRLSKMPLVGETVHGYEKVKCAGGKGLNQAVSSKRLGAEVSFIGKVAQDENGRELLDILEKENIDISYISTCNDTCTGEAYIMLQDGGKNSIIVIPGANDKINDEDILNSYPAIDKSDILISQFEVPMEAIIKAFTYAKEKGKITILNPAPAKSIPEELLKVTDILIPNETEMQVITEVNLENHQSIYAGAKTLINKGVKVVIVTLGKEGALICGEKDKKFVPAFTVDAIDTTAAGDSFIGSLSANIDIENLNDVEKISKAVRFANYFSSLVVQKKGAFTSIPYKDDINYIEHA